jgi:hypothetical protein
MSKNGKQVVFLLAWAMVKVLTVQHPKSGFGGLEVTSWPLVPKFRGSHPAETVGFLG